MGADLLVGREQSAPTKDHAVRPGGDLVITSDNVLQGNPNAVGSPAEQNPLLAQIQLTTTNPTVVYQPTVGHVGILRQVIITNTNTGANTVSVWHDDDGTDSVDATVLVSGASLSAGGELNLDGVEIIVSPNGALICQTNKASDTTVHIFGIEIPVAETDRKLLYQGVATLAGAQLYTPPVGFDAVMREMVVCNFSGSARKHSVFWDAAGSTRDKTTAIFYEKSYNGGQFIVFAGKKWFLPNGGSIGDKAETVDTFNVTIYGEEFPV